MRRSAASSRAQVQRGRQFDVGTERRVADQLPERGFRSLVPRVLDHLELGR